MSVAIIDAPADARERWSIEVSADEPPGVHQAAQVLTEAVRAGRRPPPTAKVVEAWLKTERARAAKEGGEPTEAMRRKLFASAKDLMLDRDDRLDLAMAVLERDIESWSELTYDDAMKLLTAMEGYVLVRHLRLTRRPG